MRQVLIVLGIHSLLAGAASGQALRTVALSGDPAPGTAVAFVAFNNAVLNNSGRVAFTGGGPAGLNGVWTDTAGTLALVALAGAVPPGMPAATYLSLSGARALLSDTDAKGAPGSVAFLAPTSTGLAIFSMEGGTLALVARDAGPAPGNPPGVFSIANGTADPVLNAHGRVAFFASVASTNPPFSYAALWSGLPSHIDMVARTVFGSPPPDGFTGFSNPVINDSGTLAGVASYRDAALGIRSGVYAGPPGFYAARATNPQQAPGLPPGVAFSTFFSAISINSLDQLAFASTLQGNGVSGDNNWSVWRSSPGPGPGVLELVAREGDAVPGAPQGVLFDDGSTVGRVPVICNAGHIAFTDQLRGPGVTSATNQAIFVRSPGPGGSLRMVARTGMDVPGLPPGTTLATIAPNSLALNARGQLVFSASVQGATFGACTLGTDTAGRLGVLFREGQVSTIRPGVQARMSAPNAVLLTGGSDGRQRNFNDTGEFVCAAGWARIGGVESGTGLFVAHPLCAADWNYDHSVNSQDFFDFLADFFAGHADFNANATTDSQDFFDFLAAFFVGCPV
jgi:hypothetical protein